MWAELHERQERARAVRDERSALKELQLRLRRLAKHKHCEQRHLGRLELKRASKKGAGRRQRHEIWVKGEGEGPTAWIPLSNLTDLVDGRVSVWVLLGGRGRELRKFTVRLEGTTPEGRSWMASVEMDDGPMGSGACGHALIHCHVGPSHDALPQVRVPMPALRPWDALDWVLTQVIPGWEPCPWDELAK